jgi:hypothetical protein
VVGNRGWVWPVLSGRWHALVAVRLFCWYLWGSMVWLAGAAGSLEAWVEPGVVQANPPGLLAAPSSHV